MGRGSSAESKTGTDVPCTEPRPGTSPGRRQASAHARLRLAVTPPPRLPPCRPQDEARVRGFPPAVGALPAPSPVLLTTTGKLTLVNSGLPQTSFTTLLADDLGLRGVGL